MDSQTVLDYAIFQLTPTRTRYELYVVSRGLTERMASGLLIPFLAHVQTVEEQLANGGYFIKLERPAHSKAPWFTKGTIERFVRFVSSPEVIERANIIEVELLQLEETLRLQTLTSTRAEDSHLDGSSSICLLGDESSSSSGTVSRDLKKMRQDVSENDSAGSQNSKKQLLRALEARRLVLHKEQGMAFARAAAAGFDLVPLLQLIMFSECFGASRLREACCNFAVLCKKRQVVGFCVGDLNLTHEDISWILSNRACANILKLMEKGLHSEEKTHVNNDCAPTPVVTPTMQQGQTLFNGAINFENPSTKLLSEQQLPMLHANFIPSSNSLDWSNSAAVYEGLPVMYIDRIGTASTVNGYPNRNAPVVTFNGYSDMNGPCATLNGYHFGFSQGCQQNCAPLSDRSASATGSSGYSMGIISQPSKPICKSFPSEDMHAFPSLRKLQIGHSCKKNLKARGAKNDEDGHEEDSDCERTDSSLEISDSSRAASMVFQDDHGSGVSAKDCLKQGLAGKADCSKSADSIAGSKVPKFRGDAPILLVGEKGPSDINGCINSRQMYESTSNAQTSVTEVCDDKSLLLFKQCREDTVASKSKKRLDFQDTEICSNQATSGEGRLRDDDSLYACKSLVTCEQRINSAIESEVQANQIYHNMSKQALKVNSVLSSPNGPDDLQLFPRERILSSRTSMDVLNIETELGPLKRPTHLKSQETEKGSNPSQDRVINFLSQYNEKREAKLKANANRLQKAEREGKLKSLKEDLDKRKSDLVKSTRSERARLQSEAQQRAEKLRMYKADLLKTKKEKEEEERRRLQELKAQRQSRIAARSNLIDGRNASSSLPRKQMSSESSISKLRSATRLSTLQNSSNLVRDSRSSILSSQMVRQHYREHGLRNSTKSSTAEQHLRRPSPSVLMQTGTRSIASQQALKSKTLRSPQRTTSPVKINRVPVASIKDMQLGRVPSMGIKQSSTTIVGKKQGISSGSQSGLLPDRSQKKPPSKEIPNIKDEIKHAGRTYLKKGGGAGASTSFSQNMNSASPHTKRSADKGVFGRPTTQASRLGSKQTTGSMASFGDTRVGTSKASISKNKSSMPSTSAINSGSARASCKPELDMDSTKAKPVHATVHSDSKLRVSSVRMTLQPTSNFRPRSALEKNCWDSHQGGLPFRSSVGDSVISQQWCSDACCTVNEDLNMHAVGVKGIDGRDTASIVNESEPRSTNVVGSSETSHECQSNKSKMSSSFGHMSGHMSKTIPTSRVPTDRETKNGVHAGKHVPGKAPSSQPNRQPLSGSLSSGFKESSQTSSSIPFPVLRILRNKATG